MRAGSSSQQAQSSAPPAASYSVTTALNPQSVRSPRRQAHLARGPPRIPFAGSPQLSKTHRYLGRVAAFTHACNRLARFRRNVQAIPNRRS